MGRPGPGGVPVKKPGFLGSTPANPALSGEGGQ
jgi:hypothetical protein